ncbi:MAG: hypothetical protein EP329_20965 [Deltaproteobacteria bacterium]|nr:MAG: hypothetical protein EP329_20965 [Deltaproteobacteria bacterium]
MTRPKTRLALLLPIFAVAALAGPAHAEDALPDRVEREKITVRILSDATAVVPGESLRVGLLFEMAPEWHVYWKNPGETGLPTRVTFQAPDGFGFGDVAWPAPARFVDKLGGVSFGYDESVLLHATVQVPEDVVEGSTVQLGADASWLVCHENCITGKATLGLSLPVQHAEPGAIRSAEAARFDAAAALVPAAAPEGVVVEQELSPAQVRAGEAFTVTVTARDASGQPLSLDGEVADALLPNCQKGLKVTGVTAVPDAPAGTVVLKVAGKASASESQQGDLIEAALKLRRGDAPLVVDVPLRVPRTAGSVADATPSPDTTAPAPVASGVAASGLPATVDELCAEFEGETAPAPGGDGPITSFLLALLFAFLGGVILNVMPCVLPVLSLKIMSLVEHAGSDKKVIWRHGLAYTAGVLASFAVLTGLMIALQAGTWAFQMQDPLFVAVFGAIVFAMALSLFGVYEISMPGATRIEGSVHSKSGYASSFTYGIFAVLLGTPCTAPLLGPAITYAVTQPPLEMAVLMMMVGLGLAAPFLLLAAFPSWRRIMPKPGAWLETFKKLMGFLLVGTTVFLLYTLSGQLSPSALVGYVAVLSVVGLALYVYGHWSGPLRPPGVRLIGILVSVGLIVGGTFTFGSLEPPPSSGGTIEAGGITWHDFDQFDVKSASAGGQTVFIDFTATWCATCKVNEGSAIYTDEVRNAFKLLNVTPVKADFTVHKPEIARWLKEFDEPSVPLYVVLPAGKPDGAIKLDTLLTTREVLRGICQAGPSRIETASR